mmetsp:Transcript_2436/g.7844  ORF Transcript_2436/g.7844 Transcript_2436/m.7844 type:complete len:250 (+) Transcript_2436:69-818(+)
MAPPYAHVRGVLDAATLDALRRECESLMTQCATSSYDALDVFELARALPDDASSARTDNVAFVRARRVARQILFADAGDAGADADTDATVIAAAQLRTIPQSLPTDGDDSKNVFLFNAHYVVKLPDSTDVFAWHCDGDEQLGLCVVGERSTYVSAWCPLDDVDERNGCLLFRSGYDFDSTDDGDGGSVRVHAKAGDVVFFASDIEHASGPNTTKRSRRVFYAQYSFERIVASASDVYPLAFAVPTEAIA